MDVVFVLDVFVVHGVGSDSLGIVPVVWQSSAPASTHRDQVSDDSPSGQQSQKLVHESLAKFVDMFMSLFADYQHLT